MALTDLPSSGAAAVAHDPGAWESTCSSQSLGLDKDVVELAPPSAREINPDGTRVAIKPDRRGKFVPVIMVHGWTGTSTHSKPDGAFSDRIDLSASRFGEVRATRSLIGQLQRIAGVAVFTFDYRDYGASWVDDPHLGPALGKVIDCLYKASGEKVILVGHSLGGLIARYAATHPGVAGADRAAEISTVITFGTPETGSMAALLTAFGLDLTTAAYRPLAILQLILAVCGNLSSKELITGSLCDKLPAPVRALSSNSGLALRTGSVQLAALRPFPRGITVDALAGDASFDVPAVGWFGLSWASTRVKVGDALVTTGSALDRAPLKKTVSCAYQLNASRGAADLVALRFEFISKADVAEQPLAAFNSPCMHTHLMRSIELTNEATGAVNEDVSSRQPITHPRLLLSRFMAAWWSGERQEMARYAKEPVLTVFAPNSQRDWTRYIVSWSSDCELGSSGAGGCTVTLVSPQGGGYSYSLLYHELSRRGDLVIDRVIDLGGGA